MILFPKVHSLHQGSLCVCYSSVSLDKCVLCIYHYSIIQTGFTALKFSVFHLFISHALPTLWSPATTDIFLLYSQICVFQNVIYLESYSMLSFQMGFFHLVLSWQNLPVKSSETGSFCFKRLLLPIILIAEDLLRLSLSTFVYFFRLCLSQNALFHLNYQICEQKVVYNIPLLTF